MKNIGFASAALIAMALASGTAGAADVKKGKKVFNKCKACHSLKSGKNKMGPSLFGVIGRKAASVPKFRYSKAMKKSDITWDEATLRLYLANPKKFLKGTRMSFRGIKKQSQLDNLVAYLKEASK